MVTFGAIAAYFFNVTLDWHLIPAALTAIGIATIAGGLRPVLLAPAAQPGHRP